MSDSPYYVLVTGGRYFHDKTAVARALHQVLKGVPHGRRLVIVHGGAPGADSLASRWARDWKQAEFCIPAEWNRFDKAAGSTRNQQMLDWLPIDRVVAFPGGPGTRDMVTRARKANIQVSEVVETL